MTTTPLREARMRRGRALYLSVYESQGAVWEANDCKELWCEKADRYAALASEPVAGTVKELRLCGYCQMWHSKPCGDGCYWSPTDPTLAQVASNSPERDPKSGLQSQSGINRSLSEGTPREGAPPAPAGREEIARIIDPGAFHINLQFRHRYCSPFKIEIVQQQALAKADAILALGATVSPQHLSPTGK